MNKYRVVFHLDEPSKGCADQVFRNIENLLDDLGENNVEVELVANGGGVNTLVKGPDSHAEQVGRFVAKAVVPLPVRNGPNQDALPIRSNDHGK